jgi:glycosyltransferase involved in cell wall biosynthesis
MVKDEEKMLPACLDSIRDIADELIVVDTGSSDRTVEIARSYGAIVHHHPWQKDFSLHRNQSISYATGDWILQIDADERLTEQSRQSLKKVIAGLPPKTNSVMVVIRDCTKDGELRSLWNFPRLYRNRVGAKYVGAVHNQVLVPGGVAFSDLAIEHFGYDLSPEVMRRKFRRTVTLLRKLHKENPQDPFATYFLANSYCAYRRFRHAIVWGEKTLERLRAVDKAPAHYMSVYSTLITSAMQLRRYAEVKRYASEAVQLYPKYLDAHYYLSCLAFMSKNFAEAIQHGEQYYSTRDFMLADPANCSTIMHFTLSNSHWVDYYYGFSVLMLGQAEKGMQHLSRAVQFKNVKPQMIVELVHNLLAVSKPEVARQLVEQALHAHAEKADVLLSLARELLDDGFYAWVDEVAATLPEPRVVDGETPLATALTQLILGKKEKAVETLSHLGPEDRHYRLGLLLIAELVEAELGKADRGPRPWENLVELARAFAESEATRYAAAAWLMEQQRAAEILTLPPGDKTETENAALYHMLRMQAAALCNAIDDMLAIFSNLLRAAQLDVPGRMDSISQLSEHMVQLAIFYKRQLWHDAATAAIRLAWWLDQSNQTLEARYYTGVIEDAKAFGRLSPVMRAVMREALPRPNFKEPISAAELQ